MDFKLKPAMRLFWCVMKPGTKLWMRLVMRPVIVDRLPKDLKPPYLLISNHITSYDGLIVTLYARELPVVVFDDVQRMEAYKRLIFTNSGVIFKPHGLPDPKVIRGMIKARDAGRAILLYPEGEISWTGDSKPLQMNFARLVRLLGIPVVRAKFKGGCAKQPNWSTKIRSGRCMVEYDLILTEEQIASMDDEGLLRFLQHEQGHSDIDWLRSAEGGRFKYGSPEPAKGLELLLWCCPSCHGINCMHSSAHTISCKECGYSASVDARLNLRASDGAELIYDDMRKWFDWQKDFWAKLILDRAAKGGTILKAECEAVKTAPHEGDRFEPVGIGPALLSREGIDYTGNDGRQRRLRMDEILVCHSIKF
ncbi:MAG: 2-acyl-glycerophospho-ethanolamine acyltransferase [Firmicutes bacterium ADurb.Bin153]|nr:MAG: 2-acyl-glycerophospho-ethanolamine acyltransferase [Firmicutes bacterium ADurb.Bin153]